MEDYFYEEEVDVYLVKHNIIVRGNIVGKKYPYWLIMFSGYIAQKYFPEYPFNCMAIPDHNVRPRGSKQNFIMEAINGEHS